MFHIFPICTPLYKLFSATMHSTVTAYYCYSNRAILCGQTANVCRVAQSERCFHLILPLILQDSFSISTLLGLFSLHKRISQKAQVLRHLQLPACNCLNANVAESSKRSFKPRTFLKPSNIGIMWDLQ